LPVIAGETLLFNIGAPKIYSKDGAINNDDGREPVAVASVVPDYLERFRPRGQFSVYKP